jgi:serine/threonine-protein kinase
MNVEMENIGPRVCPKCGTRYDGGAVFCQKDGAILRPIAEERDPRIGQTLLDQFRIEEKIGTGGMGAVYRAHQSSIHRDVAIKILHPDLANNADAVRRFQREARISTALDHPNVVRVFLFGQLPDGSLYLVMELIRGRPLSDLLRVEPRLAPQRAMHILTQVCDGVGEAHDQGIVHRDVKPENVMLVTKGRDPDFVKVLDFGIARLTRAEEQTQATQAGLVFGTARYISPEGAAGETTDARSDVYSLGVLGYQLFCGETPFDAAAPVTLLMKHIHEPPPPLRSRPGAAQLPPVVADVIMRALSKNPDGRFADANELGEVLRDAAQQAGIPERRPGTGRFATEGRESSQRSSLPSPMQSSRTSLPAQQSSRSPEPRSSVAPMTQGPVSTTEELSAAGLRKARRRDGGISALTVAGAFLVGVLAVVGVVVGVHAFAGPSAEERHHELVVQAESALAAHRWDGDDGVRATTDHILAEHPDDADALRIRHDAAELMVDEGDRERDRGHEDTARQRYEAAQALDSSSEGHSRIEALDHPTPHREEGIVVSPSPVEREQVIVTATIDDTHSVGPSDQPSFVLVQTRRHTSHTVAATPTGIDGTYSATYAFPAAGPYEVQFHAGTYTFATTIDVARGARPSEPTEAPVTTQGSLGPEPVSPIPSIVDAPIIHSLPLPTSWTSSPPPTTTTSAPPPRPTIEPLHRPPTTTTTSPPPTTTTTPPSLPPAWTSSP